MTTTHHQKAREIEKKARKKARKIVRENIISHPKLYDHDFEDLLTRAFIAFADSAYLAGREDAAKIADLYADDAREYADEKIKERQTKLAENIASAIRTLPNQRGE